MVASNDFKWIFYFPGCEADVYAWLVVFVLPLNSAVNPLLYTFTTPKYRNQVLLRGWNKFASRKEANNKVDGSGTSNQGDVECFNFFLAFGSGDIRRGARKLVCLFQRWREKFLWTLSRLGKKTRRVGKRGQQIVYNVP